MDDERQTEIVGRTTDACKTLTPSPPSPPIKSIVSIKKSSSEETEVINSLTTFEIELLRLSIIEETLS